MATVFVVIHDSRFGADPHVFATHEAALAFKHAIAEKWWQENGAWYEAQHEPKPADPIDADAVAFDMMSEGRGEFVSIDECEVEG